MSEPTVCPICGSPVSQVVQVLNGQTTARPCGHPIGLRVAPEGARERCACGQATPGHIESHDDGLQHFIVNHHARPEACQAIGGPNLPDPDEWSEKLA